MSCKQSITNIKSFVASSIVGIQWVKIGEFVTPAMKLASVKIKGSLDVQGKIVNKDLETTLMQLQELKEKVTNLETTLIQLQVDVQNINMNF